MWLQLKQPPCSSEGGQGHQTLGEVTTDGRCFAGPCRWREWLRARDAGSAALDWTRQRSRLSLTLSFQSAYRSSGGWSVNKPLFPAILEAWRPRAGHQWGCLLVKAPFLVHTRHLPIGSPPDRGEQACTLGILRANWTSFMETSLSWPQHLTKTPILTSLS